MFLNSFFCQAEDGIRDYKVTGVQTCALPISASERTEAWVFFDDQNLYVAVRCWDSEPGRQVANEDRKSVVEGKSEGFGEGGTNRAKRAAGRPWSAGLS